MRMEAYKHHFPSFDIFQNYRNNLSWQQMNEYKIIFVGDIVWVEYCLSA